MTEVAEPTVREMRYSASYGGWFWTVTAPNPAPLLMPDGKPNMLDGELWASGFAKRKRTAEREINRAKRKHRKAIQRYFKEIGDEP